MIDRGIFMRDFIISTDNTADLPISYLEENHIRCIKLAYMIDGETYGAEKELDAKEFYKRVRDGSMPTTSQVNPEEAKDFFEEILNEGYDILQIAFSSGLSGTFNNMKLVANDINEERKESKVIVVDSLCASLGEGLLVHQAVKMKKEGRSIDEIAEWLENHKLNMIHMFTVDDLNHLHRGGRVSKATAVIGTMVNIKPILHVDEEGHLTAVDKVRGRKKSLQSLVNYMDQKMGSYREKQQEIFISHGDCVEDAEYVADLIKERYGITNFLIHTIGPTIGAHSGPGTVTLFFLGDER